MKKFSDCVRPGVEDVRARPRTESRELIRLDLPTFERPKNAISGLASRGQSASVNALLRNSAVTTFINNLAADYADKRSSAFIRVHPRLGFSLLRLRPVRQRVVGRARSVSACGP